MSVNDEGARIPSMMPGREGGQEGGEVVAEGAVLALGWVMAELFDPRRRSGDAGGPPPFDPRVQLPLVADLSADPKLLYLAAELGEYLQWFPRLARPLRLVTAEVNRKRAAVSHENLATAEAAEAAGGARADDAGRSPAAGAAAPFSPTGFLAAVTGLHQAILDEFADDPERLCAYQLGLSLSDLVWLPSTAASGRETAATRPSGLFALFTRSHLATVHTLLGGAGRQLPAGAAAIVSRSLDNWADWIDVNSARLRSPGGADAWSADADVVLRALRLQGWVWRSVLIADPDVSVQPSMGAWVHAGASIARAARMIGEVIVRRFWPLVLIALAVLGGLLYLVISTLSGAGQVWASLVTVAAVVGSGSWGLGSALSSAFNGVSNEIWNAAKLDASAWNVTWLPALSARTIERARLERRGVAMPQIRKSLDV